METLKTYLKQAKTIPNILSFIRIALIPVFCWLMISAKKGDLIDFKKFIIALVVFVIAGLTDLFDGKIARRFNQVTDLGKLLDPIADKLTQFAVAIILITWYWGDWLFIGLFSVYIIKEIFQLIAGAIMLSRHCQPTAAEIWGKASTMVFYIVMVVMFLTGEKGILHQLYIQKIIGFDFVMPKFILYILVGISVILMFLAFFSYIPDYMRSLKHTNRRGAEQVILASAEVLVGLFLMYVGIKENNIVFGIIASAFGGSALTLYIIGISKLISTAKLPKGDPLGDGEMEKAE